VATVAEVLPVGAELFDFSWPLRPEGGFVWVERRLKHSDHPDPVPVLMFTSPSNRSYRPLAEVPCLYRIFTEVPPTAEGAMAFAQRFGHLGSGADMWIRPEPEADRDRGSFYQPDPDVAPPQMHVMGELECNPSRTLPEEVPEAEPLFLWQDKIRWLRHLLHLYDMAFAGDRRGLAEFVRWDGPRVIHTVREPIPVAFAPNYHFGWRGFGKVPGDFLPPIQGEAERYYTRGDLVAPALHFVQYSLDEMMYSLVKARCAWNRPEKWPAVVMVPVSLLGAILLQFARAMDGKRHFRRCQACREWFVLEPGINRADKLTCSDNCRMRLHRLRRAALALRAQRKSYQAIAEELGVDGGTVKSWVQASPEKE
jgi:hypothetical protein